MASKDGVNRVAAALDGRFAAVAHGATHIADGNLA
jgi:hypothetical protein